MEALRAMDGARWRDAVDPTVEARLAAAIDELARLPVLDAAVLRIVAAVDDPDTATPELVRVLESDPAFAASLLRYANSDARAHPIRARTIRSAVMLVGRRALRQLALETAVGERRGDAVCVAAAAVAGCDRLGIPPDVPHVAALLHDVGTLVLPRAFGAEAYAALVAEHPSGADRVLAERERLGVDHALAGALLADRWALADGVCEAIALHHGGPGGLASPTEAVAVVQVVTELRRLLTGGAPDHALLEVALARCGARSGPRAADAVVAEVTRVLRRAAPSVDFATLGGINSTLDVGGGAARARDAARARAA